MAIFSIIFTPFVFANSPTPPNVTVAKIPSKECETLNYKAILKESRNKNVVLEIKKEVLEDIFAPLTTALSEYSSLSSKEKQIEITVITNYERKKESLDEIEELNQEFSFATGEISVFTHLLGKIVLLPVSSPDLDHLRSKYGLPAKKFSGELFLSNKKTPTKKESPQ